LIAPITPAVAKRKPKAEKRGLILSFSLARSNPMERTPPIVSRLNTAFWMDCHKEVIPPFGFKRSLVTPPTAAANGKPTSSAMRGSQQSQIYWF